MNIFIASLLFLSQVVATDTSPPLWTGGEYKIYASPSGTRAYLAPATENGQTVFGCITAAGLDEKYLVLQGYPEYFFAKDQAFSDIPFFYFIDLSKPLYLRTLSGPLSRWEYGIIRKRIDFPRLTPVLDVEHCKGAGDS